MPGDFQENIKIIIHYVDQWREVDKNILLIYYYSILPIFCQFWLAQTPQLILHNQLTWNNTTIKKLHSHAVKNYDELFLTCIIPHIILSLPSFNNLNCWITYSTSERNKTVTHKEVINVKRFGCRLLSVITRSWTSLCLCPCLICCTALR